MRKNWVSRMNTVWACLAICAGICGAGGCGGSATENNAKNDAKSEAKHEATNGAPSPDSGPDIASADGATVSSGLPRNPATADGHLLGIGDKAPSLSIGAWLQGDKINQFEAGNVYVVEFWATWCGPCKTSMPHLSKLQEEYQEKVQFVGITAERPGEVNKFLAQEQRPGGPTWSEVIAYRIALDQDAETNTAYMEAANIGGIPHAFIVGKTGLIEWHGHPMAMDEPLKLVVEDKWDRVKASQEQQLEAEVAQAIEEKKPIIIKAHQAATAAQGAEANEHWDRALGVVDELHQQIPADSMSPSLIGHRDVLNQIKQWLLSEAGRTEQLAEFQSSLVEQYWSNPQILDSIAWKIVSDEGSNLDLALKAAQQAVKLTNSQSPSPLDTLAHIYAKQGNFDEAIKSQTKAVEAAGSPPEKAQLEENLEKFRKEAKEGAAKEGEAKEGEAKEGEAKEADGKEADGKEAEAKEAEAKEAK
ncbi:MAG: redoxin domain-containing protein [Planctomycetales bacterium]|nr:redoxin domain-containing protein [Planctomycetales bacterium]